jgi:hypothetical protein
MYQYMTTVHQTGEVFQRPRDVENTGHDWNLRETHVIGGFANTKAGAQVISCIMAVWTRDTEASGDEITDG